MNYPSIKTIATKLNLAKFQAKNIRDLMDKSIEPETYDCVKKLISQCYNPPDWKYKVMTAINDIIEGYGLEYIEFKDVEYVNMGDTYTNTVCLEGDRFKICCWGDFFE